MAQFLIDLLQSVAIIMVGCAVGRLADAIRLPVQIFGRH